MQCRERLALQYRVALLQAHLHLLQAQLHLQHAHLDMRAHVLARRRRRRGQRRRWWSRAWLSPERRRQFGLYDQLMVELRREDSLFCSFFAFTHFFFTYNYNVKYSGALEVVCPVTNPVSLYTFRCVRYVTCRNTFDVRFGRYSSGTRSVCALHVR
jgi:hypothetical protein